MATMGGGRAGQEQCQEHRKAVRPGHPGWRRQGGRRRSRSGRLEAGCGRGQAAQRGACVRNNQEEGEEGSVERCPAGVMLWLIAMVEARRREAEQTRTCQDVEEQTHDAR